MKINYNLTGTERKALVGAISSELNVPAKYLGMPTAAYWIDDFEITKTGELIGPDNRELVADLQNEHGFTAASEDYDELPIEADGGELAIIDGSDEISTGATGESDQLIIEMPLTGFTPEKLENLVQMVEAKAALLKAAFGVEELPIRQLPEKLVFPWFSGDLDGEHTAAYADFISLLCKSAKGKKRVTAKVREIEGSPKYAMRCFLLSIGMIGPEHRASRRILLEQLEGSSSFKNAETEKAWQHKRIPKDAETEISE
jgi:hypothetical protein